MINVGGHIAISQAIAARFEQARASMQTNLDRTTQANTPGVQFVLQSTVDVNGLTLTVGQYIVLPASTGAQATTPTVTHLDLPGALKLTTFRVHDMDIHSITFFRNSMISDNVSNDACIAVITLLYLLA